MLSSLPPDHLNVGLFLSGRLDMCGRCAGGGAAPHGRRRGDRGGGGAVHRAAGSGGGVGRAVAAAQPRGADGHAGWRRARAAAGATDHQGVGATPAGGVLGPAAGDAPLPGRADGGPRGGGGGQGAKSAGGTHRALRGGPPGDACLRRGTQQYAASNLVESVVCKGRSGLISLRPNGAEENYPALTGGWSGRPDGQLGFPGNPAAIEVGVTSTNPRPRAGPRSMYFTELRNYRSCMLARRPY
eukprot:1188858-Prorocentrum_minimum.AAC.2